MTLPERGNAIPDAAARVAVAGAGPAGFYAAQALLARDAHIGVDIFERLPGPFGLVRYGVAPDHPKIRQVTRVFDRVATDARVAYYGNVMVGRAVSVAELLTHYHAVILACGCEAAVPLGIPGEQLSGVAASADFARWYNGHPDFAHWRLAFDATAAVIVGHGNVAVDTARMLARSEAVLRATDMPPYAVEALCSGGVRDIYIVGRRGPVQARFTAEEIAELGELPDTDLLIDPADLQLDAASQAELEAPENHHARRRLEVLRALSGSHPSRVKRIHILFGWSPVAISGTERVEGIRLERNRLAGEPGRLVSIGTGQYTELSCGLVFTSIGHRALPLAGVPFDAARGIVPNAAGRVVDGGAPVPGLYVAGWMKRGAKGLIGNDRADSAETVEHLLADRPVRPRVPGDATAWIKAVLRDRRVETVSYDEWKRTAAVATAPGSGV